MNPIKSINTDKWEKDYQQSRKYKKQISKPLLHSKKPGLNTRITFN